MSVAEELSIWQARRAAWLARRPVPYTVARARKDAIRRAARVNVKGILSHRRVARSNYSWAGEWTLPVRSPICTIVHAHGSNAFGSTQSYRRLTSDLCVRARCRVFSVDYRRPPEVSYPAAYDDLLSVMAWINTASHPIERTILAGDSFGGALALAAAIHLRNQGLPQVAGLYLLCPKVDYSATAPQDIVSRDPTVCPSNRAQWGYWNEIGTSDIRSSPYLADLSGLPPVLIHTSTADNLYAQSTALRDKLLLAGNDCDYREWEIVPHIWPVFGSSFTYGREAMVGVGAWVTTTLNGT